jgi:tRNA dimethylallyltransferase
VVAATVKAKFIALVGPTASGKSDLALRLAEAFNGEIVCADSRTIFQGMDIGTAKPTAEERGRVPHHLLDVVEPGETLSAGKYKQLAEAAILDIAARGKLPLLVGGSGLYVDGVVYDFKFAAPPSPEHRRELEELSAAQLLQRLESVDPARAQSIDRSNRRRVIRALETVGQPRRRAVSAPNVLLLGLRMNKEVAQNRIEQRVEKMLKQGFIEELTALARDYGWDSRAFDVIGYRAMKMVALGHKTLDEGVRDFVRGDLALFKKQMTWFKRDPHIRWLNEPDEAFGLVQTWLG